MQNIFKIDIAHSQTVDCVGSEVSQVTERKLHVQKRGKNHFLKTKIEKTWVTFACLALDTENLDYY